MQDVYSFFKLGDVHDPERTIRFPDTDFAGTSTHFAKRFPAFRLKTRLDLAQLEPRLPADFDGKGQQIVVSRPDPTNFLPHHASYV